MFGELTPWVKTIRSDQILLPRHDDHLGFVNPGAKTADCTHYCMGSPGWYEHVSNMMTIIVDAVQPAPTTPAAGSASSPSSSLSARSTCEHAVGALDAVFASGMGPLAVAVLGYTSPVTLPLLMCLCAARRRCRSSKSSRARKGFAKGGPDQVSPHAGSAEAGGLA